MLVDVIGAQRFITSAIPIVTVRPRHRITRRYDPPAADQPFPHWASRRNQPPTSAHGSPAASSRRGVGRPKATLTAAVRCPLPRPPWNVRHATSMPTDQIREASKSVCPRLARTQFPEVSNANLVVYHFGLIYTLVPQRSIPLHAAEDLDWQTNCETWAQMPGLRPPDRQMGSFPPGRSRVPSRRSATSPRIPAGC